MRAFEVTEHGLKLSKTNAFTKVKTLFGSYFCDKLSAQIQVLHQSFRVHTSKTKTSWLRIEFRKNSIAKRMGFHPTASLFNFIKLIYLSKLSTLHPTRKAYVYKRFLGSKPKALKVTNMSCSKCDTFLLLTESKLQCTIPSTDSAIIRDQNTQKIITVIIWDFAKDYYDYIVFYEHKLHLKSFKISKQLWRQPVFSVWISINECNFLYCLCSMILWYFIAVFYLLSKVTLLVTLRNKSICTNIGLIVPEEFIEIWNKSLQLVIIGWDVEQTFLLLIMDYELLTQKMFVCFGIPLCGIVQVSIMIDWNILVLLLY